MKFIHNNFSCDVQIFNDGDDIIMRFFDKKKEHDEKDICNYVLVDAGFGFLCLKSKGEDGLLSGYLDDSTFSNNEMVEAAIEFIESQSHSKNGYIPHLVKIVKTVKANEYNGEF